MYKNLFFGMEIHAPWPKLPSFGRHLEEKNRHLTLAFLGQKMDKQSLLQKLSTMPNPPFNIGFVGFFDKVLFLPEPHPHVVAWHIHWEEESTPFLAFQKNLLEWLQIEEKRPFKPHVTLARNPSHFDVWKKEFFPLPLFTQDLVLFESLGNSQYEALWRYPLLPPFEEIEHTADRAYLIRASSYNTLFDHAKIALAFTFPPLLQFFPKNFSIYNLHDIVQKLNEIVTKADQEVGCPFKAISYHGDAKLINSKLLEWEMIIDI